MKIKIVNILNFPNSIEKLINYNDNSFIKEDYQDLVKFFNEITIMDECMSIFTNEVALFYLIKKNLLENIILCGPLHRMLSKIKS